MESERGGRTETRWGETRIGETGASCYNFHSKSIFHKNMNARDFLWT